MYQIGLIRYNVQIPNQKKLIKNDFNEDNQALVEQLAEVINYNFETSFNALNKNLSLGDNLNVLVKDIEVTVDSSGIPITSIKFTSSLKPARPIGSLVIDQINLTNSLVYPTSGIVISYSEVKGIVTVNHITGLPAGNKFKLKVVFFA